MTDGSAMHGQGVPKLPTGIGGFDDITRGGLPAERTSLFVGSAGAGKTVFALQTLVHAARTRGQPGIFVAFEESAARIVANAATFGWDLPALAGERLFFLDAQPGLDLVKTGAFDLSGLLAAVEAKARAMGAAWVAFDALDAVLMMLDDTSEMRRECGRLQTWLESTDLTAIVTLKGDGPAAAELAFLPFMTDVVVRLHHGAPGGISRRALRVVKYRGSAFEENEAPFVIDERGIEVAYAAPSPSARTEAPLGRVSSGSGDLDAMLAGGYRRGAAILLTGAPGTAKTTLAGAFAQAACARGEPTLYISFDSRGDEMTRDLASVGVDLATHLASGLLSIVSEVAIHGSGEVHLMRISRAAERHGARCLVIDPVSALSKVGVGSRPSGVLERLVAWAKRQGITLLCTSLLDSAEPTREATRLQVSTLADTWIHLSYVIHAGERNRGLSIVKSRGTAHSNQVRELVLSDEGLAMSDVYTAGGEVLMGTLRYERERADDIERARRANELERRRDAVEAEQAELELRAALISRQLARAREAYASLGARAADRRATDRETAKGVRARRGDRAERPDGRADG